MDIKREEAFNEVIDKLDELGLLPYVILYENGINIYKKIFQNIII